MSSRVLKAVAGQALPKVEWRDYTARAGAPNPKPAVAGSAGAAAAVQPAVDPSRLEREAYERGFREGEAAGARKGLEQLQAAIRGFAQSAGALASYKPRLRAEAERDLVRLALTVAQKIVRRELSVDPNVVLAVVKSCLDELDGAEIYRLRLNPQDVAPVSGFLEHEQKASIEIVPDPKIGRGGALFETAQGQLDARLETQLEEIERGLADR